MAEHALQRVCHAQSPRQAVVGAPQEAVRGYKIVATKEVPREYRSVEFEDQEKRAGMIFPTCEEEASGISAFPHRGLTESLS